jgi:hypothetical protein
MFDTKDAIQFIGLFFAGCVIALAMCFFLCLVMTNLAVCNAGMAPSLCEYIAGEYL